MALLTHGHLARLSPHFNKELGELYASTAIRGFAISLVGIFEPIYIFLFFDRSIPLTLLYFAIVSILFGVLAPFGGKMLTRLGIKHAMLWSVPFLFLYFLALWQIEKLGIFFLILIPFHVMHNLLYWPAFHIDFARFSEQGKRGKEVGVANIVISLASAFGPLVGGLVITFFGFPELFAIVLALLFASTIPLFLSQEIKEEYPDDFTQAFRETLKKNRRAKVAALGFAGAEFAVHAYIWPLYLFMLAISFEELGAIISSALVIGMIFIYFIGKASDKMGPEKLLTIGSILNAVFWPIKMFVRTPFDAFLAHTLHNFGSYSAFIPFAAIFYDWAGKYKTTRDRLVIVREIALNVSRGVFLLFLALVFLFTDNLAIVFLMAGFLSLGFILMKEDPMEIDPMEIAKETAGSVPEGS
ncbi:MAG: MFS transporter [Candidatus Spechtbacterales bacterium]